MEPTSRVGMYEHEDADEARREQEVPREGPRPRWAGLSTGDLVGAARERVQALVRMEIDLATAEAKADLRKETGAALAFVIAAVAALMMLAMLLVAVVFALVAAGLPGWGASLLVAGVMLVVAVIAVGAGRAAHVKDPLPLTRRSVQETLQWAKELP